MITSKVILKEYIDADKSRNMVNCSAKYLLIEPFLSLFGVVRESFYVRKYLLVLRKLEYYTNVRTHYGGSIMRFFIQSDGNNYLINMVYIYIQILLGKDCIFHTLMVVSN